MTAANQNDENKPEARSNQPGRPVPGTGAVTTQKQNLYNKTHTLQSYHIDRIAGQKKKKRSCSAQLSRIVHRMERERTKGHSTSISHVLQRGDVDNDCSILFSFSIWYLVSGLHVHIAYCIQHQDMRDGYDGLQGGGQCGRRGEGLDRKN